MTQDFSEIREKGNLTSALVLIELLKGKRKLREISVDLDMTPQGVANYLKILQKSGYIDKDNEPTKNGIAFLQRIVEKISSFAEHAYEDTGIISSCEAIAGEDLRKNERVNLVMNGGILYAYKYSRPTSSGICDSDVSQGSPVRVSKIEGVIDHRVGNFFVMPVDFDDFNAKKFEKLKGILVEKQVGLVGAYGTLALKFCNAGGIDPNVYAPVEACIEAGARGVNSLLVYSNEMARFLFQKLSANINKYKINPKFVEL
jgi:predicted transcriptional regulator